MSSVHLVGITSAINADKGIFTPEELIVYMARVSNPSNQNNMGTATGLIQYLIRHKHWSPFEMVHMTLEIETTRDIGRQILRHRSFSFQEFSQRYADPTESLGFELREARLQDTTNRQNSLETEDQKILDDWKMLQTWSANKMWDYYKAALDIGIAKEQARALLPEGLTISRMYMAGSLRSWIHYCDLRMGPETQKEHRLIAMQCWEILKKHFPNVARTVEDGGL